jgi:hypothetical protein
MRALAAVAIGLALGAAVAPANPSIRWKTVVDQHGSSVRVPYSILKQMADPLGLTFKTRDGRVSVQLWTTTESRPDFPGHNPTGDLDFKRADCDRWPPKFYKVTDQLATYSCVHHGKVAYYLGRYSPSGSVILFVTYPTGMRKPWDQYVQTMARSLRQVERHEIR